MFSNFGFHPSALRILSEEAIRRGGSPGRTKISAEAAAKAVEAGKPVEGHDANEFAIKLDRTTTMAGAYPVVLVSFHMVCSSYD